MQRRGDADKQCDREIPYEVVDRPTERRAWRPAGRAQGTSHKQDHHGPTANFCAGRWVRVTRSIIVHQRRPLGLSKYKHAKLQFQSDVIGNCERTCVRKTLSGLLTGYLPVALDA